LRAGFALDKEVPVEDAFRPGTRWLGVVVGVVLALAVAAQPAAASTNKCDREFSFSFQAYKRLCMHVVGIALYVQDVKITRNEPGSICNWRAAFKIYPPHHRRRRTYKGKKHVGCSFVQASYTFHPKRNFPNQSRICAFWFNNGDRQDAAPCATIHK
jgi:hypothetical protein